MAGQAICAAYRDALPDEGGEFAHGPAGATAGSLPPDRFGARLDVLGVPAGPKR